MSAGIGVRVNSVLKSVSICALYRRSQLTTIKAAEAAAAAAAKLEADDCEFEIDNISQELSIIQSCLEGRPFVEDVHVTLPREICDMI
jgi:hypothetical protein